MNNIIIKEINDYTIIDVLNYIGTIPPECNIYNVHEDNFEKCICTYKYTKQLVDESKDIWIIDYKEN